jgi:hypothetical protein
MNMVCPKYTIETEGGRTFTVRTIKDWNALDVTLRKQKSIATFKRSLLGITAKISNVQGGSTSRLV